MKVMSSLRLPGQYTGGGRHRVGFDPHLQYHPFQGRRDRRKRGVSNLRKKSNRTRLGYKSHHGGAEKQRFYKQHSSTINMDYGPQKAELKPAHFVRAHKMLAARKKLKVGFNLAKAMKLTSHSAGLPTPMDISSGVSPGKADVLAPPTGEAVTKEKYDRIRDSTRQLMVHKLSPTGPSIPVGGPPKPLLSDLGLQAAESPLVQRDNAIDLADTITDATLTVHGRSLTAQSNARARVTNIVTRNNSEFVATEAASAQALPGEGEATQAMGNKRRRRSGGLFQKGKTTLAHLSSPPEGALHSAREAILDKMDVSANLSVLPVVPRRGPHQHKSQEPVESVASQSEVAELRKRLETMERQYMEKMKEDPARVERVARNILAEMLEQPLPHGGDTFSKGVVPTIREMHQDLQRVNKQGEWMTQFLSEEERQNMSVDQQYRTALERYVQELAKGAVASANLDEVATKQTEHENALAMVNQVNETLRQQLAQLTTTTDANTQALSNLLEDKPPGISETALVEYSETNNQIKDKIELLQSAMYDYQQQFARQRGIVDSSLSSLGDQINTERDALFADLVALQEQLMQERENMRRLTGSIIAEQQAMKEAMQSTGGQVIEALQYLDTQQEALKTQQAQQQYMIEDVAANTEQRFQEESADQQLLIENVRTEVADALEGVGEATGLLMLENAPENNEDRYRLKQDQGLAVAQLGDSRQIVSYGAYGQSASSDLYAQKSEVGPHGNPLRNATDADEAMEKFTTGLYVGKSTVEAYETAVITEQKRLHNIQANTKILLDAMESMQHNIDEEPKFEQLQKQMHDPVWLTQHEAAISELASIMMSDADRTEYYRVAFVALSEGVSPSLTRDLIQNIRFFTEELLDVKNYLTEAQEEGYQPTREDLEALLGAEDLAEEYFESMEVMGTAVQEALHAFEKSLGYLINSHLGAYVQTVFGGVPINTDTVVGANQVIDVNKKAILDRLADHYATQTHEIETDDEGTNAKILVLDGENMSNSKVEEVSVLLEQLFPQAKDFQSNYFEIMVTPAQSSFLAPFVEQSLENVDERMHDIFRLDVTKALPGEDQGGLFNTLKAEMGMTAAHSLTMMISQTPFLEGRPNTKGVPVEHHQRILSDIRGDETAKRMFSELKSAPAFDDVVAKIRPAEQNLRELMALRDQT